jgi:hypothetical protein
VGHQLRPKLVLLLERCNFALELQTVLAKGCDAELKTLIHVLRGAQSLFFVLAALAFRPVPRDCGVVCVVSSFRLSCCCC